MNGLFAPFAPNWIVRTTALPQVMTLAELTSVIVAAGAVTTKRLLVAAVRTVALSPSGCAGSQRERDRRRAVRARRDRVATGILDRHDRLDREGLRGHPGVRLGGEAELRSRAGRDRDVVALGARESGRRGHDLVGVGRRGRADLVDLAAGEGRRAIHDGLRQTAVAGQDGAGRARAGLDRKRDDRGLVVA